MRVSTDVLLLFFLVSITNVFKGTSSLASLWTITKFIFQIQSISYGQCSRGVMWARFFIFIGPTNSKGVQLHPTLNTKRSISSIHTKLQEKVALSQGNNFVVEMPTIMRTNVS